MREDAFLKLSQDKQDQLLAFRQSKIDLNESEAHLENQKRWRIVFEKAPPETIPLLIYCTEVAIVALISLWRVISLEGIQLYIGISIIFCTLFFPLLVLPGKSWVDLWNWFKKDILRRK
ncbi:hypothetical protein [Methanococcoides burtonii]|uniref:hypothetical protein n=1 Tax=Methanococcoides burtonii TaxID=29291 RepID=UPI00064E1E2D|nr:hypothetical protein [Methanococcoides burtonii]